MFANELITTQELSERLRVSRWTLYEWAHRGIIPSIRPGGASGKLLFNIDDVMNALKTNQTRDKDDFETDD